MDCISIAVTEQLIKKLRLSKQYETSDFDKLDEEILLKSDLAKDKQSSSHDELIMKFAILQHLSQYIKSYKMIWWRVGYCVDMINFECNEKIYDR